MSDAFKHLNYLLTIMGYQRSQKNRKGLNTHLQECDLEPILDSMRIPERQLRDCGFCHRTVEMWNGSSA